MEKLTVHGKSGSSQLLVGEPVQHISTRLPDTGVIVITDERVYNLYPAVFQPYKTITIACGEGVKTLNTVIYIYEQLMALGAGRSTFIVGVGGGVVCDIAGFTASTYLRGLRFGFVPTTLLAQVDASVGGKNGVNFQGFKNRIGTINQPEFVLCDPAFFATLPEREIRCGLGEVVKHALIADADMFDYIESHITDILSLQPAAMKRLVLDSVRIKSAVVNRDEREQGERRILNFGHTLGHIIEERSAFNHGEAVAAGMVVAANVSQQLGCISEATVQRIIALLQQLGLPVQSPIPAAELVDALSMDKKREGDHIHFVVLNDIGRAAIKTLPISNLQKLITHLLVS